MYMLVTQLFLSLLRLHQAPLSMGFPRQEYWSGLPFPFLGIKPRSSALQADSLPSEPPGSPRHCIPCNKILINLYILRLFVNQRYFEDSKETNCKQGEDICNALD